MVNSVSAVNVSRQSTFKPATQAAAKPRQALAFKSNDDFDEPKKHTVRNAIIGTVAGLALVVGASFAGRKYLQPAEGKRVVNALHTASKFVADKSSTVGHFFLGAGIKIKNAVGKIFKKAPKVENPPA
jgi:hypothetical protein